MNNNTDRLTQLIEQKCEVLMQLRQLADRQLQVVTGGEMTTLMTLLAVKQGLLQRLQQLEAQLDPFRDQDPETRIWRSITHREQARELAKRCETLLSELMSIDRQCEGDLVLRRDQVSHQLHTMHDIDHAANAYTSQLPTHSHLDLSSET